MRRSAWSLGLLLAGCAASLPRPAALDAAEAASSSPAARDAQRRAPQAHAHAEQLRRRAEAAQREGATASAQILAEHALAAHEHAVVLARLSTAGARRAAAQARLAQAENALQALDDQHRRVLAETEDLELRARVLRDTLPLPENAPTTPERERARLEAAQTLALNARLLCTSARLLAPERSTLPPVFTQLDALDGRLAKNALPAPVDEATKLRSTCLSELTHARRPKTIAAPARGATDLLLTELASAAYEPVRDERGVVVTLRDSGGAGEAALEPKLVERLSALGRVAQAHAEFPVLLVLHTGKGAGGEREQRRLQAAAAAIKAAGATRVETAHGGDAAPVLDPRQPNASQRNARLEVVFVAPSAS